MQVPKGGAAVPCLGGRQRGVESVTVDPGIGDVGTLDAIFAKEQSARDERGHHRRLDRSVQSDQRQGFDVDAVAGWVFIDAQGQRTGPADAKAAQGAAWP